MTTMSKVSPEELKTLKRLRAILNDPWVKKMMAGKSRIRKKTRRPVGRKKAAREAAAFWRRELRLVKHLAYDSPAMRQRRRCS